MMKKNQNNNAGSIYMYTLSDLLVHDSKGDEFLKIRALGQESSSPELMSFDSKKFILVKIGRTVQPVAKRIQQWQRQCNKNITLISPDIVKKASPSSLWALFSKLTIEDPYYSTNKLSFNPNRFLPNIRGHGMINKTTFKCFNECDNSFHCRNNLSRIEKEIHNQLRDKFGAFGMECDNCSLKKSKVYDSNGGDIIVSKPVTHREWFRIPKQRLNEVFLQIESICHNMESQIWENKSMKMTLVPLANSSLPL
ncbi:hypothetical protein DASC09_048400 [Saccharomycopsis crataegensis]|uniref:C2H2-type domain-containing protein n=1 Tax=Saccharomycopsis crataegensis TaxID=43959 RepID=A0AAV5QSF6_9ASCO|nr:hypothetical protein DASC09_048400 [Saccharomycopsis crataegensis]